MSLRIHWRLVFDKVTRYSTLRLWVGCFIYFKFTPVFFKWIFNGCSSSSIKEINRLLAEINSGKGMSVN